jgi:peptidoglycan/LPS O-acetylase OafA/YrhL
MTSQKNITPGYIPQLDGIRGLAIILVVSFHYLGFIPIFSFGWCGVDLFFVLSGYLITSRLIVLQQQKNHLLKFYKNRALRIMPLYYLTLILFYAGIHLLVKKENLHFFDFYNYNFLSFFLFFQNWSITYSIYAHAPREIFLDHFWSLAIEEQFYLVWPFFLYKFWQKKFFLKLVFCLVVLIIIARTIIYIQYPEKSDYNYYYNNTFCRMDAFLIGGCLLILQHTRKDKQLIPYFFAVLLIIILGIYFTGNASISNPFISTIGYTLIALFFAGLIYAATSKSSKFLSTIFNYPWLRFTGKISYGLYIFHWLVLRILEPRFEKLLTKSAYLNSQTANGVALFICLVVSYVLSVLSYFYFESYFLKLKNR